MNARFLKSSERKKILKELEEEYGIAKLPYLLIETGKQKIRAFSGSFSKEEIMQLSRISNVEIIGMYIISKKDNDSRLSFDAVPIFKDQINKKIVEINKEQFEIWIRGHDLEIVAPIGNVLIKYNEDLVGLGKSNTTKIFNYIPKERKLKKPLLK